MVPSARRRARSSSRAAPAPPPRRGFINASSNPTAPSPPPLSPLLFSRLPARAHQRPSSPRIPRYSGNRLSLHPVCGVARVPCLPACLCQRVTRGRARYGSPRSAWHCSLGSCRADPISHLRAPAADPAGSRGNWSARSFEMPQICLPARVIWSRRGPFVNGMARSVVWWGQCHVFLLAIIADFGELFSLSYVRRKIETENSFN
ncbi:hypothetical protein BDA96_01G117700 [Sorghum bicolor]|uniref:Uncharacterized protein n=1 Tax=Sorghum bicolor TaxID=4558 RepID=A0A921UXC3_SORBI|nr:hypothetical protein BDA96_01G117700 [Sorghum bicolor]